MWPFTISKVITPTFVKRKYTKQVGILFDLPQNRCLFNKWMRRMCYYTFSAMNKNAGSSNRRLKKPSCMVEN